MRRPASAGAVVAAVGVVLLSACSSTAGTSAVSGVASTVTSGPTAAPSSSVAVPTPSASAAPVAACLLGWQPDASVDSAVAGVTEALAAAGLPMHAETVGTAQEAQAAIARMADSGCPVVVGVDPGLESLIDQAADQHRYQPLSLVSLAPAAEGATPANVARQELRAGEAAYLAGFLAAGMTVSGVVGTYADQDDPAAAAAIDAFERGVRRYNRETGAEVAVTRWAPDVFDDADAAADVVMATSPETAVSAASRSNASADLRVIGYGSDGAVTDPAHAGAYLTSVLLRPEVTTMAVVQDVQDGRFDGGVVVGGLSNGAVGLAPFHGQEDAVPDGLRRQVADLEERIVSGEVSIDG